MVLLHLLTTIKREGRAVRHSNQKKIDGRAFEYAAAALPALLAMVFHSLGDFNLQMPATTWLLASLTALAMAGAGDDERNGGPA
jgi:4-amino-4-deoxy-L-arabinose transferase-like glycosyltransferase